MPRNIEIKARIASVEAVEAQVAALAERGPVEIPQDDTFFACARGRLKLRALSAAEGQLIFYQRADQAGPKESFFVIAPTTSPDLLREALARGYGQVGRVRKHRTLYLIGRTRIHLDRVEELGHFLELEVVLSEDEPPERGVDEAHRLMAALGISSGQLIDGAYVDLLVGRRGSPGAPASMTVRALEPRDRPEWCRMRCALWPHLPPAEHEPDMDAWLARRDTAVVVAARESGGLGGFAEVGTRPYADGCRTSPVAFLEGWYVDPADRGRGVGRTLVDAVEAWARDRGLRELASDALLHNGVSQQAHARLGFVEVERAVRYRKPLR